MIAGSKPKTVLPPDKTRVGAVAAANAEELPTIALPARARATIRALVDFLFISMLLISCELCIENYLVVKVPVTVRDSAPESFVPAAVDETGKVPVNLRVPVAPAYFPVPPVMIMLPLIATEVGAAPSLACAVALGSKLAFKVLVPSEMEPAPEIPAS